MQRPDQNKNINRYEKMFHNGNQALKITNNLLMALGRNKTGNLQGVGEILF